MYGTEARYACNPGHLLNGPTVRTCDHTGSWSDKNPTCEGKLLKFL